MAIKINQGKFEVHDKGLFDKFEKRSLGEGVTVVFAHYSAFDRWTTQEVTFDEEKFDKDAMVAYLEEHHMLPIDVMLEDINPQETDPLVVAASLDVLVTELYGKPITKENIGLHGKLKTLMEVNKDSGVDFSKAIQILDSGVSMRIMSPMSEGQEVWIQGLGRWVVTDNLIYRPKCQIPHVLHKDSPVPPKDVAWLPSHTQYSLADKYRYWEQKTEASRTKMRDLLVDKLEELNLFD